MRYALAALLFVVLVAGCATDEEDHVFFNQGWVKPEKAADERLMQRSTLTPP